MNSPTINLESRIREILLWALTKEDLCSESRAAAVDRLSGQRAFGLPRFSTVEGNSLDYRVWWLCRAASDWQDLEVKDCDRVLPYYYPDYPQGQSAS